MPKITIDVQQDDIDRGQTGNCWFCPITLATCRALTIAPSPMGSYHISTRLGEITFQNKNQNECTAFTAELPPEANEFIEDFDTSNGRKCPFTFDIFITDAQAKQLETWSLA